MELDWISAARHYETGVDRGALYFDSEAVPWNGLISVVEGDSSEVVIDQYVDGVRSMVVQNQGDFEASIECYAYPEALDDRDIFDFSYRVSYSDGHKIHLVYNALFRPEGRSRGTLTASPSASTFGWRLAARPEHILSSSPAAHLVFDTRSFPEVTSAIESILYGSDSENARLPSVDEVMAICDQAATLRITHNGDGTWTATGPDDMVRLNEDGTFEITAPTAFDLGDGRFVISSF